MQAKCIFEKSNTEEELRAENLGLPMPEPEIIINDFYFDKTCVKAMYVCSKGYLEISLDGCTVF